MDDGTSVTNVRFLLFYVRFTPESYRYISKVRQANVDPTRKFRVTVAIPAPDSGRLAARLVENLIFAHRWRLE